MSAVSNSDDRPGDFCDCQVPGEPCPFHNHPLDDPRI